jgi:hypothetical protein
MQIQSGRTVLFQSTFSCKNLTFCDLKSDQDPDPHGSALNWLPESGSAVKPMRVHNTGKMYLNFFLFYTDLTYEMR